MWKYIIGAVFLVIFLILYAVIAIPPQYEESPVTQTEHKSVTQPVLTKDYLIAQGEQLYKTYCFTCHGYNGDAYPVTPEALQTQYGDRIYARDFTGKTHLNGKVVFKYTWGGYTGEYATDEDLKKIIRHGLYGTPMPGYPNFTEQQLDALITYIKTFNDGWKNYTPQAPPDVSIPFDLNSAERIQRGRELYLQKCTSCHMDQEKGMKPIPQALMWNVPGTDSLIMIHARDFTAEPLRLPDPVDVFRTIKVGIGGTTMNPALWQELNDDQIWDLVSYVYYLRNKGKRQGA